MAGVAGPMAVRDRRAAARFLSGLLAGEMLSSVLIAVAVLAVGAAVALAVPWRERVATAAAAVIVLGLADVAGRTPHAWRQVPQALIYALPAGRLGLSWGFDLGLLFTTQKVTSLVWAVLAVSLLAAPVSALYIVPGMALVSVLAVTLRAGTWSFGSRNRWGSRRYFWAGRARTVSGLILLALGGTMLVGVF